MPCVGIYFCFLRINNLNGNPGSFDKYKFNYVTNCQFFFLKNTPVWTLTSNVGELQLLHTHQYYILMVIFFKNYFYDIFELVWYEGVSLGLFHKCVLYALSKFTNSIMFPFLPSSSSLFRTVFGEFHYAVFKILYIFAIYIYSKSVSSFSWRYVLPFF
jgi:hypothetical protein